MLRSFQSVNDSGLRQIEYKDSDGRLTARLIPVDAPDEAARIGVVLGPPPMTGLDLPEPVAIAFNNELYHRGLLTEKDIRKNRNEAGAALMAACRLSVDRLLASLHEED